MSAPVSPHPGGATGILVEPRRRRRGRPPGPPRDGDGGRGGGGGGDDGGGGEPPAPPLGDGGDVGPFALGLVLLGIGTFFTVLVMVALLLRRPAADWRAQDAPSSIHALWISTALLFASSLAIEVAARHAKRNTSARDAVLRRLRVGLLLGLGFLGAQAFLWLSWWRAGLVPSSSGFAAVFFACTGLHALHVLGGLTFLLYLERRFRQRAGPGTPGTRTASGVRLAAVYWHFMGVIWLVLFALLYFMR